MDFDSNRFAQKEAKRCCNNVRKFLVCVFHSFFDQAAFKNQN
jgi:hypothetical protein